MGQAETMARLLQMGHLRPRGTEGSAWGLWWVCPAFPPAELWHPPPECLLRSRGPSSVQSIGISRQGLGLLWKPALWVVGMCTRLGSQLNPPGPISHSGERVGGITPPLCSSAAWRGFHPRRQVHPCSGLCNSCRGFPPEQTFSLGPLSGEWVTLFSLTVC